MGIVNKDDGTNGIGLTIENASVRFVTRGLSNLFLDTGPVLTIGWHHIAALWNPATGIKAIYVDGALQASVSGVTGSLAASTANLQWGLQLRGRLQDLRYWSEARQASAIAAFRDKTLTGQEANLAGYWKLDEKRGTRVEDATEIGNDGNITGGAWVDDDSILGTERRYQCNGVIFTDQAPGEILEDLLTSMGGSAVFSGGQWHIRAAAYEPPTVELGEADAFDAIKIQPKLSRRELFNAVRGIFISPENQYQATDFPLITNAGMEAQDGGERIAQDIELPFTSSSSAAQRMGFLHLLRNREQVQCQFPAKLNALRLLGGGTCMITDPDIGWSAKPFDVMNWELAPVAGQDSESGEDVPALGVRLELRETNAIIYDFNPATDEVPLNPSPDSNLPSPFGKMALVSEFVDRNGFEFIARQPQAANWPGSYSGLVRNPLTGHLNAEDQIDASGDDFNLFDNYVQDPIDRAYYESPEIDIEFNDMVRTYAEWNFHRGPGQLGQIGIKTFYDAYAEGGGSGTFDALSFDPDSFDPGEEADVYDGWKPIQKTVRVEARYFKHRIEFDFRSSAGYLAAFTPVIEKMTLYQRGTAEIVATGGKSITFLKRYHNVPSMSWAARSPNVRTAVFPSVTKTGFEILVFDQNADDSGGVIDWQSAGV